MGVEPSHSTPDGIKSSVLPLVPHPGTYVIPKLFHLLTQRVLKQTFHFGSLGAGHCGIVERLAPFARYHKEVPHPLTDRCIQGTAMALQHQKDGGRSSNYENCINSSKEFGLDY